MRASQQTNRDEVEFHSGKLREGENSKTTDHTVVNWMTDKDVL